MHPCTLQGADTVIYERLDPAYKPNEAMKESTTRHMEEFGSAGLRTLCLSYTEVDRDWYNTVWSPQWVEAKTSLQDRDAKVGVALLQLRVQMAHPMMRLHIAATVQPSGAGCVSL